MHKLSLADIHCDTAYEIFKRGDSFADNKLAVSYNKAKEFERYMQVMAIWSEKSIDDDTAYLQFFKILEYLKKEISELDDISIHSHDRKVTANKIIISVEDARILNNDISRLKRLYNNGVRIITLLWSGVTCIGGSFDTDEGLTDFGKAVVKECCTLGIIPDISHASLKSAYDVFEICDRRFPVIASHSDAFSVFHHPRNLNDEQFYEILASDGLVGVNLCAQHLGTTERISEISVVLNHIEHFLSLGGEDILCMGCDFDGANTPSSLQNISSLYILANEMSKIGYSNELIDKIFYLNAEKFLKKYILKK